MKKIVLGTLVLGVAAFAAVNVNSCKGCHGGDFGKKALGKSDIVSEMSQKEVFDAIKGYKEGTYGGMMKGLMKGQVAKYSEKELKEISELIGKAPEKTEEEPAGLVPETPSEK
jgi:cytochrome c-type protein NapB